MLPVEAVDYRPLIRDLYSDVNPSVSWNVRWSLRTLGLLIASIGLYLDLYIDRHAEFVSLSNHATTVTDVGFSPTGTHLASSAIDGTLCVRSMRFWGHTWQTDVELAPCGPLRFSTDGAYLAAVGTFLDPSVTRSTCYVWELATGKLAMEKSFYSDASITFVDGTHFVTIENDGVQTDWDLNLQRAVAWRVVEPRPPVMECGLIRITQTSPTGRWQLIWTEDEGTHVVGGSEKVKLPTSFGHCCFSPDDNCIAAGLDNGIVRVYPLRRCSVWAETQLWFGNAIAILLIASLVTDNRRRSNYRR
jgi:WD40 repeat protein